jgi:hypothetical protein
MSGADIEEVLRADRSIAVTKRYDMTLYTTYLVVGGDEYTSGGFVANITCFGSRFGNGAKMPDVGKWGCHGWMACRTSSNFFLRSRCDGLIQNVLATCRSSSWMRNHSCIDAQMHSCSESKLVVNFPNGYRQGFLSIV